MAYYARFDTVADHVFRFDTRIYLGNHNTNEVGECVGAIVGKNPGSAKPTQLGVLAPLKLDGDKMLPSVRNRFIAAYQNTSTPIPNNVFVQVWNLFYLCNPDLGMACSEMSSIANPPFCPTENKNPMIVWFAWGNSNGYLNPFKKRFLSGKKNGFYYNHQSGLVVSRPPTITDFAKHPQGMPKMPIVNHLTGLLQPL